MNGNKNTPEDSETLTLSADEAMPYDYALKYEKLLRDLIIASSPYLKRKKGTARSECNHLNEIHARCRDFLV